MLDANDTCLDLRGSFSWGFTSNNQKAKKGNKNKIVEQEKDEKKQLSKFVTLREIDIQIQKGEFVCIIGDVGSGKSSLLQTIIGDLIYLPVTEINNFGGFEHEGSQEEFTNLKDRLFNPDLLVLDKPIKIRGSISYVSQSSWIQNMTIQDNILFGQKQDGKRYKQTIRACQLERDLDILPAGD